MNDVDLDQEFGSWDYGVTLGLGMEQVAGRGFISADARYMLGMANLLNGSDRPDFRTRGISFTVGVGL